MKISIDINNKTKSSVTHSFLMRVAKNILCHQEFSYLEGKKISLSLAFVNEEEIRKLNRRYRCQNKTTDVLSFSEYKNVKELKKEKSREVFLGEIILCYNDIAQYCQISGCRIQEELARVLSHGVLHLLGFRHNKKMFALQNSLIRQNK